MFLPHHYQAVTSEGFAFVCLFYKLSIDFGNYPYSETSSLESLKGTSKTKIGMAIRKEKADSKEGIICSPIIRFTEKAAGKK